MRLTPSFALLGILAVFATSAALSLHGVDAVARAAAALALAHRPVTLRALVPVLNGVDAALAAGLALSLAALITTEWRARSLSTLLADGSRGQYSVLLLATLVWLGHYCFVPGVLLGGDTATHIVRFREVREALLSDRPPLWTNDQYLGSPLLIFTGPLLYLIGGAIDIVVRNPVLTAKIILFVTKVATGVAMYRLIRRLGCGRAAAWAAACGMAGAFAYVHLFLYRGVFPQSLTILFLVLLFHAAEGIMRPARRLAGAWLLFALMTAGLIVNHQPHALFASFYLAIFGAISLAFGRWSWRRLPALLAAGVLGVVASTIAVVPILVEAPWVMIEPGSAMMHVRLPGVIRLWHLLAWRDTRTTWGPDYWAYLGIVLVFLAVLGTLAGLSGRLGGGAKQLVLCVLPALFVALFVWNPVVRDVMFLLFFVSILAALGVERLRDLRWGRGHALAIAAILLLADFGSTSVQPVARLDKGFLIAAGRAAAALRPPRRLVEIIFHEHGGPIANIGPNASPLSYAADVQRIAGTHNMAATHIHNFAVTVVEMAGDELARDGRLSPTTSRLLALLNVGRVICMRPLAMGCPSTWSPSTEGDMGAVLRVADASPVVFAPVLVRLDPAKGLGKPMFWDFMFTPRAEDPRIAKVETYLRRYLAAFGPMSGDVAEAIPVRDPSPTATAAAQPGWTARLEDYRVGMQDVRIVVRASGPGFVQIAHPWYPATRVRVNGHDVAPLRGAIGLMVLPIGAGISVITLVPTLTATETWSAIASLAGLVAIFLVVLWLRSREAAARHPAAVRKSAHARTVSS